MLRPSGSLSATNGSVRQVTLAATTDASGDHSWLSQGSSPTCRSLRKPRLRALVRSGGATGNDCNPFATVIPKQLIIFWPNWIACCFHVAWISCTKAYALSIYIPSNSHSFPKFIQPRMVGPLIHSSPHDGFSLMNATILQLGSIIVSVE